MTRRGKAWGMASVVAAFAAAALAGGMPAARAEVYLPGPESDAREASFSKDPKVELPEVKLHDLVTVRVKDVFQFKNNVTSSQKKEYDLAMELADWFNIQGNGTKLRATQGRRVESDAREEGVPIKLGLESEKESKGNYNQSDQRQLTASITAEIVDMRPNGTLVLEARKVTQKDDDRQVIIFTGVARRQDITAENTIDYDRIANPVLKIEQQGPSNEATSKGWLAKVIDVVWPF